MTQSNKVDETRSRIVLCDDSKLVRVTAKKILGERFDLVLLEDGQQAWERIVADPEVRVVFTDLGMPNLDGYGLIEKVRQSTDERIRQLPVIVITGAAEDEKVKKRIYDLGATDFITKPFTPTAVLARAESHTNYLNANQELKDKVNIDLVTQLLNQKGFQAKLAQDISFVRRHNEHLAVAMFELDQSEDIQTNLNESVRNKIYKEIARLLLAAVRKEDTVARVGACRFVVSFPMAKSDGVIALSRRLSEKIKGYKIKWQTEEKHLSVSVGIAAMGKGQPHESSELIQCAERALDNAQSLGQGEIQFLRVDEQPAPDTNIDISIDEILEKLSEGKIEDVKENMDIVMARLSPLLALLNEAQRNRYL